MRRHGLLEILLLAALLTLSSCALLGRETEEPGPTVGRSEPAVISVTNLNWSTVTVYVIASGRSIRLGSLSTNQTETYRLADAFLRSSRTLQFRVDPLGSGTAFHSEIVSASTSADIVFTIQNNLDLSTITLR